MKWVTTTSLNFSQDRKERNIDALVHLGLNSLQHLNTSTRSMLPYVATYRPYDRSGNVLP